VSSPLDHTITSAWEQEGQRISPALDFRASALIVGSDPVAAAEVALGIARAQARRRRVCVADVVGELKPIEDLIPFDFEYGLMDAFFQGVSLNKVAFPVDPARNLLLLPSGPKPIDHDGILASARWASLAAGFRDAGALLLVIAPYDSAGTTPAAMIPLTVAAAWCSVGKSRSMVRTAGGLRVRRTQIWVTTPTVPSLPTTSPRRS